MDSGTDWLYEILQKEKLEQFYLPLRDELQITRLPHFDYIKTDDLERIGISKPSICRLQNAVKKKNWQLWKEKTKKFWKKLLFGSSSSTSKEKTDLAIRPPLLTETRTTCVIFERDLTLFGDIGTGSYGVVKKGEWRTESGKTIPVAVKVLKADLFSPGVYDDFQREVEAMHSMKHSNLIKLHGVVGKPLMMVCELADMGALLDYLRARNGKISLNYISKWSEQVAAGMAHLENNRFLHRDLACRNILMSSMNLVKIGDFGLTRALPDADDCYVMSERRRVPFPWCAPESLRSRQFSHASDVWMFAVALWEMYSFGEEPWIGLNGSEILRLIMQEKQRLTAPSACPPDVYMLMMHCWHLNPKERPTFAGIQKYMESNKFETAIAALSYRRQDQMTVEAGDVIVLIDKRPELRWWKGQNQRTLEIGLFPSNILKTSDPKTVQVKKKSETMSARKIKSPTSPVSEDDSAVELRKRRTIESSQPLSTRAGNAPSKQINYNKLTNDRTPAMETMAREKAKSLNIVKEDPDLIDLDLSSSNRLSALPKNESVQNIVSILDEPIDVPQFNSEPDWGEPSTDSLPNYSQSTYTQKNQPYLYGAKSLDNLVLNSQAYTPPDPFDPSPQCWPQQTQTNYNISKFSTLIQSESQKYSINNCAPSTSADMSHNIYTNAAPRSNSLVVSNTGSAALPNNFSYSSYRALQNNSSSSNYAAQNNFNSGKVWTLPYNSMNISEAPSNNVNTGAYGTMPNSMCSNTLSLERNAPSTTQPNIAAPLAAMSLDDKISESLNLRIKNSNTENIYANNSFNDAPSTSAAETDNSHGDTLYNDMALYENFDINPIQQQFFLESKDFYSKLSTNNVNTSNDYEKNIYVPECDAESGKLRNYSKPLENSKNHSAKKYQNVDNYQYGYTGDYASNGASTSRADVRYDEVNDTASNIYSEIGDTDSVYGASQHRGSARLYDEVYETAGPRSHRPAPAPHRPAPPCPARHK